MAWVGSVFLKLSSKLADVHPEIVAFCLIGRSPDLLEELSLGEELSGASNQDFQQPPFGRSKADLAVRCADAFGG
jgi:hypothetical protein